MWYKTRMNSIPPNITQFSSKMSWFWQLVGNVSECFYKKITINWKCTLLYYFSLSNARQGGFIKGTGSGLPDCWIYKPIIVINCPLMSLFRTKKTKVMIIIFGLFIQQSGKPAPAWIHQNVMQQSMQPPPPTPQPGRGGGFDLEGSKSEIVPASGDMFLHVSQPKKNSYVNHWIHYPHFRPRIV